MDQDHTELVRRLDEMGAQVATMYVALERLAVRHGIPVARLRAELAELYAELRPVERAA